MSDPAVQALSTASRTLGALMRVGNRASLLQEQGHPQVAAMPRSGLATAGTIAPMLSTMLSLQTGSREVAYDLTADCRSFVSSAGGEGLLHIFVPHATAGVAILEVGAGSDDDLLAALRDILPGDDRWIHRHGSPGHGRSHVMPAFIAPFATVPFLDGALALGTWQSICLVDLNVDNTHRQVRLSMLRDSG